MKTTKAKEKYDQLLRDSKNHIRLSLRTRLTLAIGMLVMFSILSAFGIVKLMEWIFPFSAHIPIFVQLNLYALIIAWLQQDIYLKFFLSQLPNCVKPCEK